MAELRRTTGTLIAAFALGLASPAGAGAATEIGQLQPAGQLERCEGTFSIVQRTTAPGVGYQIPAGGGVLTGWRHRALDDESGGGRVQVWRVAGGTNYTLIGRSEFEGFAPGVVNEFPTRIPVGGGELIGLRAVGDPLGCVSDLVHGAQDVVAGENIASDPTPGQTRDLSLAIEAMRRANVAATLEPDADSDGFGDESQDVHPSVELDRRVRAKRSGFPASISCGPLACQAELTGQAVARRKGDSKKRTAVAKRKKKKFKLKPTTVSVEAQSETQVKLRLKNAKKSTRKIRRVLKRKELRKRSKLKVSLSAANTLGATGTAKETARLKR